MVIRTQLTAEELARARGFPKGKHIIVHETDGDSAVATVDIPSMLLTKVRAGETYAGQQVAAVPGPHGGVESTDPEPPVAVGPGGASASGPDGIGSPMGGEVS